MNADSGADGEEMADVSAGEPPLTAQQVAEADLIRLLDGADHIGCEYIDNAEFIAEGAVCGCGLIITDPELADTERLTQHGKQIIARGHEQTGLAVADPITRTLPDIDPTQILTPDGIGRYILETTVRLERGVLYERALVAAAHAAETEHEMSMARALLHATGGDVQTRRAAALVACEDSYRQMMHAKATAAAMKACLHSLRSALSGYQSANRTVEATYHSANIQGRAF